MAETPIKVELPGERLYSEECYIQTFTLNDARSLFTISKTTDIKQLFKLIDKRINLEVKKLTIQDLWYIFYWQRINSYPNYPMRIPWECPECSHKNSNILSADKLIIEDLDPEYEHGVEFNFPSARDKDGSPLYLPLRLQLVGDELEAETFLKSHLGIPKPNQDELQNALLACMLEPTGESLADRYDWVVNVLRSADDIMALKSFEDHFNYGVINHADFECEECKEEARVSFNFDLANFFPTVRDSINIQSRILPRKKSKSTDKGLGRSGSGEIDLPEEASRKRSKGAEEVEGLDGVKKQSEYVDEIEDVIRDR